MFSYIVMCNAFLLKSAISRHNSCVIPQVANEYIYFFFFHKIFGSTILIFFSLATKAASKTEKQQFAVQISTSATRGPGGRQENINFSQKLVNLKKFI